MPQLKKETLRVAILDAAFSLFSKKGYTNTTMGQIARKAGTVQGNIYRYYDSKFQIFQAVFQPWFEWQIDALERRLLRRSDPRWRLREILLALWRDIPRADNGFHHNLMQALATKRSEEHYSRDHLHKMEMRVTELVRACLPPARRDILEDDGFLDLAFMASDGFTLSYQLVGPSPRLSRIVDMTCALLLGDPAQVVTSAPDVSFETGKRMRLHVLGDKS